MGRGGRVGARHRRGGYGCRDPGTEIATAIARAIVSANAVACASATVIVYACAHAHANVNVIVSGQAMSVNRVERLIINLDMGMPLMCAWDDCYRQARTPYQIRVHEHAGYIKCWEVEIKGGRHMHYAFCSERCKAYWLAATGESAHDTAARNRGRIYGQLPDGMKHRIT